ncbi:hypothetical protein BDZ91DRAFT_800289 [Kalaharituber pfeilii]|nr:hypothetical protein BDZ91DRAFT_800289 [Kalaharituber pfeilii]
MQLTLITLLTTLLAFTSAAPVAAPAPVAVAEAKAEAQPVAEPVFIELDKIVKRQDNIVKWGSEAIPAKSSGNGNVVPYEKKL